MNHILPENTHRLVHLKDLQKYKDLNIPIYALLLANAYGTKGIYNTYVLYLLNIYNNSISNFSKLHHKPRPRDVEFLVEQIKPSLILLYILLYS